MSFSKAKIHRFNEETTCAPPPGTYDPKFDTKVKGAIIDKSKRFNDQKLQSASSMESLDSASSSQITAFRTDGGSGLKSRWRSNPMLKMTPSDGSNSNKECPTSSKHFPQLPKKKPILTPRSVRDVVPNRIMCNDIKIKKKLTDVFRFENEKKLVEQIDELTRAHTSQLLEKNQEISALNDEIEELKRTIEQMNNTHQSEKRTLVLNHEEEMKKLTEKLETQLNMLNEEREAHKVSLSDLNSEIEMLKENLRNNSSINYQIITEMDMKYAELEVHVQEAKKEMDLIISQHKKEVEEMTQKHEEELKEITNAVEMNSTSLSQKLHSTVESLERDFNVFKMELEVNFKEKLETVLSDIDSKIEDINARVKSSSARLVEFEMEFSKKITDFIVSLKTCDEWNDKLVQEYKTSVEECEQTKLSNLEHKICIVDLQDEVEKSVENLTAAKKRCRKFEIAQGETNKTLHVLSSRLFESQTEVECLNSMNEEMKFRCAALEERVKCLVQEGEANRKSLGEMQLAIVKDVQEVECQLLSQLDSFRKIAAEETKNLRQSLEEKQSAIDLMLMEIDFYRMKASESADYIALCQTRMSNYKEELRELENKFIEQEEDFTEKINAQRILNNCLKEDYDKLLEEKNSEKEEFMKITEGLRSEKEILEKECDEKSEEMNNLKVEINDLQLKLNKLDEERTALEESNFENERHIEELALKLDHYKECASKTSLQIESLTQQLQDKTDQIHSLEESITERDLKVETLSEELNEGKTYVQTVTEHMVSLMNELSDKSQQIENLLHDIDIKNATMIQVSEEYEKIKTLYEIEVRRSEEIEKDMQDTQRDNEKYVDELISELVLEKERCSELSESLKEVSAEKAHLLERIDSFEKLDPECQIEEFKAEKKELLAKLSEKEIIVNKLEMELADNKLIVEGLVTQNSELRKLEEKYKEEAEEQEKKLKEKEEEVKILLQTDLQAQDELFRMQEVLKERETSFVELQDELAQHLERATSLEDKVASLLEVQVSLESQNESLSALKSENERLQDARNTLEKQLENIVSVNSSLEARLAGMEKRKNEYKHYALELEENIKGYKQEIIELSEEKEKLREQCHEDSMKYTSLNAQIADLECRNRELEMIIGPYKEQLIQFELERNELLSRTENTEKELHSMLLEHAKSLGHQNKKQKIKYIVNLTETIADQKKEIDKLRLENSKLRLASDKADWNLRRGSAKVQKNKENPTLDTTSPLKGKPERHPSPASALKQRNAP